MTALNGHRTDEAQKGVNEVLTADQRNGYVKLAKSRHSLRMASRSTERSELFNRLTRERQADLKAQELVEAIERSRTEIVEAEAGLKKMGFHSYDGKLSDYGDAFSSREAKLREFDLATRLIESQGEEAVLGILRSETPDEAEAIVAKA